MLLLLLLKNYVCLKEFLKSESTVVSSRRQLLVSRCNWTNWETLDSAADGPALTHRRSAQPAAWFPAAAIYHSVLPISLPLPLWDSEHVIWSQQATSQTHTHTHHTQLQLPSRPLRLPFSCMASYLFYNHPKSPRLLFFDRSTFCSCGWPGKSCFTQD